MNRVLLVLLATLFLLGIVTACGKVEKKEGEAAVHEKVVVGNDTVKTEVSDEEARKYFDQHAQRIRMELHVWQILYKDNVEMALKALHEIESGASFEQVAKKRFPVLPEGAKTPWDIGYLRWNQIPAAWHETIYSMEEGEISSIIPGPANRLWIIMLVDRRENPAINFENQKSAIKTYLAAGKN